MECATQAQTNVRKREDISREANFVKAKLETIEEMGPNAFQSFPTQALEILATSCAFDKATRARWFDPVLACVCAQCNAAALDEQANQLSNLLSRIAGELQIVIANRTAHFNANVLPLVPDQSSVIRRRDKVMDFLRRQEASGLVCVVGIHGEGGLGKTTIMHAMKAEIVSLETHAIAFVEVGEKPSKPLHELQSDLTYQLSGKHEMYQNTSHGKSGFIRCMQSLRKKIKEAASNLQEQKISKACIFIDNVWEKSQLRELLPEKLGGIMPPSSYLVISSRFKLVVDELDFLCFVESAEKKSHAYWDYNPQLLDRDEAEDFFVRKAASRGLNLLPAHEQIVHNIVPLCGGLPLLLEVYSSYFSSATKADEWERVAEKLRLAQDLPGEQRVFEILKTSISRLESEALKEAFMDIALFYSKVMKMEDIQHYLDEVDFFLSVIEQSLISIKEYDGNMVVEVHDLLRTVADSLNQEKKMVYIHDNEDMEPASQDHDKVRAAIIGNGWEPRIERMSQLRYLEISGLQSIDSLPRIEGLCCELRALRLKIDIVDEEVLSQKQPDQVIPPWIMHSKKIRFLELINFPWQSFATAELPLELRVLLIAYDQPPARREQLPPFSANIGRITRLRRLALENCSCHIPTGIEKLQSLTSLTISTKGEDVPEGGGLVEVGASIGALTNLQELGLAGNPHLRKVSGAIGQLVKLEILDLSDHPLLQGLPDELEKMSSLVKLNLSHCVSLTELPPSLANLASLEWLDLSGCNALAKLPDDFSQAEALKRVWLGRCPTLMDLPPSLASLTSLEWLDLSDCGALAKLPNDFSQAVALKRVWLGRCSSLMELPPSLASLASLEWLDISDCIALAKLPDDFSKAKALKRVWLGRCSSLTELPPSLASLASLEWLDLSDCITLAKLPDDFSQAKALKRVWLGRCSTLMELPPSLANLASLEELDLSDCSALAKLPDDFSQAKVLKRIGLNRCSSLTELPPSLANLASLEALSLSGCTALAKLPDDFSQAEALKRVYLDGCSSLTELPPSLANLASLEALDLSGCSALAKLPVD